MRCPTLQELPPPPPAKTGWPWTEETLQDILEQFPSAFEWPKICICTPALNQSEFLEKSIRSVLLQGYPNLEYIIIDGGSKDESVEIIRKYENWLTYWVSEPDRGISHAINKGFTQATGNVFGIMLGDDIYCPGAMFTLAKLRADHPGSIAWVGACPQFDEDGNIIYAGVPFINDIGTIGDFGVNSYLGCPGCMFDADAFWRCGGLDEKFKNANDVELWVKLSRLGTFITTNQVVARIRYDPASVSNRDPLAEIVALIALNYLHGHSQVSKSILNRHLSHQGLENLATNQAIGVLPVDILVRSIGFRALFAAVVRRVARALKRRVFRSFRTGRSD